MTGRRATAPARGFTPEALEALSRRERRQLVQSLVVEAGLTVVSVDPRGEHDDFIIENAAILRPRRGCVRVVFRPLRQQDVDDLAAVVRDKGFADAVLVEAGGHGPGITAPRERVQLVRAAELIERLEASSIVRWRQGSPHLDRQQYALLRSFSDLRPPLDHVGLRWLTSLSLNKLPHELSRAGATPETLFERIVFRVLTMVFRFGGLRLGARTTGTRAPDALLASPAHARPQFAALLDCKAARDGYLMGVDDERALLEYVSVYRAAAEAEADGAPLQYVIIVSSSFPGGAGDSHPYRGRAEALSTVGVRLVYLEAADLVNAAVEVEQRELQPRERELIDWQSLLEQGHPPRGELADAVAKAGAL